MRGRTLAIALAVVVTVVLVCLPSSASRGIKGWTRDTLAPFQNVVSQTAQRVRGVFARAAAAGRAADNERDMLAEIGRLRCEAQRLQGLRTENDALRRSLAFRAGNRQRLVAAEVVGRGDISGWWQKLRLDKGLADGVTTNRPVITAEGLVGRTLSVSDHTAEVLLVSDPTCRVACKFSRTGAFGVGQGGGVSLTGRPRLEMLCAPLPVEVQFVDRRADILAGDEVVTSGLGGVFPEGLAVGRVVSRATDKSGLFQRAQLVPSADLARLRYVFVIPQ